MDLTSYLEKISGVNVRTISRIFNPRPQDSLPGWELFFFPVLAALKVDAAGIAKCRDLWRRAAIEAETSPRRKPDDVAAVLRGNGFLETLRGLYDQDRFPLVQLFGTFAPICVFPAPAVQWTQVEAALGPPPFRQPFPTRMEEDPRRWPMSYHPDTWRRYAAEVARGETDRRWDGPTWAFDRIHLEPAGVRIDCVSGRYYRSLATSECLDKELMDAHRGHEHESVGLDKLPYRAWLHDQVGGDNVVLNGSHRNAAVSVAVTVMLATEDGGFRVLLTPRSEDVATHRYFNHVIPSGIFQPLEPPGPSPDDAFIRSEFNVERTFHREFLEELYGAEEYGDPGGRPISRPEREPEIVRLKAETKANLFYTGVSVNLLTLRPEICLLLLITDPAWLERESETANESAVSGGRPMKYGWEIAQHERDLPPGYTFRRHLDLDRALNPVERVGLQQDLLVPNAAAAIHLALKVASAQIS